MKHSFFVEIITLGLFLFMFFNWLNIYIRVKLCIRSFVRKHIAQRVNSDVNLDFPLLDKEQPTGIENSNLIKDLDNKFILSQKMGEFSFTVKTMREYNPPNTFIQPTHPNAE